MQIIGSRRQPTAIILPNGHIKLMPHHILLSYIKASLNLYQGSFGVQERMIKTETPGQGAAINGTSLSHALFQILRSGCRKGNSMNVRFRHSG